MKKPAAAWKPVPVAVQVKRHHKAVAAARKAAHRTHAQKVASAHRSQAAKKAAKTRAAHRKWSPDESVALCSARAVAQSLLLTLGMRLSDDEVLGLYWATAAGPDDGQAILEALEAAGRQLGVAGLAQLRDELAGHGLDGDDLSVQAPDLDPGVMHAEALEQVPFPARVEFNRGHAVILGLDLPGLPWLVNPPLFHCGNEPYPLGAGDFDLNVVVAASVVAEHDAIRHRIPADPECHALILGLDLPWGEPHAVVAHAGAWWSWGQPWSPEDFPGAVIEEAWSVSWQ